MGDAGQARGRSGRPRPANVERANLVNLTLSVAGLLISLYLWSAKAGASRLICGPLGDCAAVNTGPYSEILGLPVAALGACMYLGLVVCAALSRLRRGPTWTASAGFALAVAGSAFSTYLTALEAFVIGAYCVWCLLSWVLVTAVAVVWGVQLQRSREGE